MIFIGQVTQIIGSLTRGPWHSPAARPSRCPSPRLFRKKRPLPPKPKKKTFLYHNDVLQATREVCRVGSSRGIVCRVSRVAVAILCMNMHLCLLFCRVSGQRRIRTPSSSTWLAGSQNGASRRHVTAGWSFAGVGLSCSACDPSNTNLVRVHYGRSCTRIKVTLQKPGGRGHVRMFREENLGGAVENAL